MLRPLMQSEQHMLHPQLCQATVDAYSTECVKSSMLKVCSWVVLTSNISSVFIKSLCDAERDSGEADIPQ